MAWAQQGQTEALEKLLVDYKSFVKMKARPYFLIGADQEDVIQEGMIGLYKAIKDYRPDRNMTFKSFAGLCITRQILTAIKAATRQKHQPLNQYISLNREHAGEEGERTLLGAVLVSREDDPEYLLINKEEVIALRQAINDVLSNLEREVLNHYLTGLGYLEIAERLGRTPKSMDNALQRIKKKMANFL